MGLRRVLAADVRLGGMLALIPFGGAARRADRAWRGIYRATRCAAAWRPTSPDFFFSVIRFRAAMELGRWSYGSWSRTPNCAAPRWVYVVSRSDIQASRDAAAFYPLAAPRAAPTEHSADCREPTPLTPPGGTGPRVADFFLAGDPVRAAMKD